MDNELKRAINFAENDLGFNNPTVVSAKYSTQERWDGVLEVLVEGEIETYHDGVPTGHRIRKRELITVS